ncbi:ATP-binding protein [Methylorubrum extorquens]
MQIAGSYTVKAEYLTGVQKTQGEACALIEMKFDILGRINNMRLPDGKTALLYSVYEAVSNSIHAINDRFGEDKAATKGRIDIDIGFDDKGDVSHISVTDNGIGFTEENIELFETSDSRHKYKRGGKGVERFIWIKMFQTIRVDSVITSGKSKERVRFRFAPEKIDSIAYKRITPAPNDEVGTTITLSKLRHEQRGRVRPSSYLKDLSLHFFPSFYLEPYHKYGSHMTVTFLA